jgi:hypothetical protein
MVYRFLVMCMLLGVAFSANPDRLHAQPRQPQWFKETGHVLADPFQSYWERHGGLPVFGYPISEAFGEQHADAEQQGWEPSLWTQYFERNRLEAHPDNEAPYDVLLGRLGVEVLEAQHRDWRSFPKANADTPHYFAPTGHAIGHAAFWDYWSSHGLEFDGQAGFSQAESLALWGYPISKPTVETNASGDRVLTQWFERARFEDHDAEGVLLGLLGSELAVDRKDEPAFRPVPEPGRSTSTNVVGKIVYVRAGDAWLYLPRTGETRKLIERTTDFRWSPDGRLIAFVRADGIYVARADGTNIRRLHAATDLHQPVWAPDGTRLAFVRGTVQQIDNSTRDIREVWTVAIDAPRARKLASGADPAWAPDSKRLAYITPVIGGGVIESHPGAYHPGRNELHIVDWQGQNDRTIVRDVPANTPQIDSFARSELGHALAHPFWDRTGGSIYVLAAVIGVPDAMLYSLERADVDRGGSTFVKELANVGSVEPSPDGRAFLAGLAGLGGGPWFQAYATQGDDATWQWASTQPDPLELKWPGRPAWAPDARAVAYVECEPRYAPASMTNYCSLALLTSTGTDVLLRAIEGAMLDWGRD